MKIYTKTGDDGTTSLIGGERVKKYDCRVEAYGTVDELTAYIALLGDMLMDDERTECLVAELRTIECRLMSVAALLAVGRGGEGKVAPLNEAQITDLEGAIDRMQGELKPIARFTIPGGHHACSLCHVCRTVCRRAERSALRAADIAEGSIDTTATRYLNRLSDYLYTLCRLLTERFKVEETLWEP